MGVMKLLTVQEAAELLKTSKQQIRKMIRSGLIPAVRIGREWRISVEYLEQFLQGSLECVLRPFQPLLSAGVQTCRAL